MSTAGKRFRQALLALLALAVLAAANWWLTRPTPSPARSATADEERIDYALSDFHARFFDRSGALALELRGPALRHNALDRVAEIDQPRFVFSPQAQPWQAQARAARIARDAERLELFGNVIVEHSHPRGPLNIRTEKLQYERAQQRLHAPVTAHIEQGGNTLSGGTLTVWIDDERMEFDNNVHAILRDDARAAGHDSDRGAADTRRGQ